MSGYKAIGAVSATLRTLLLDRMEDQRPVTIAPPGVNVTDVAGKRVNLFLYQITENAALKNQEIPGHGHPSAYGSPPLSLDLNYLVSVLDPTEADDMTETAELESQEILGDVMRVLHDHAMLNDGMRTQRLTPRVPILDALLLNQFERVKLYLQPVELELLTDLWTSLSTSYRLSVAYQVCVVQIESRVLQPPTLPVLRRGVFVQTLRSPQITEVFREPPEIAGIRSAGVTVGETLRIVGTNLTATPSRVVLGGVAVPTVPPARDDQLDVQVPASLPAGVHTVAVVQEVSFGTPTEPHLSVGSNVLPFLLLPTLSGPVPEPAAPGATVTVTVAPPVRAGQRVVLLLGDRVVPAEPLPGGATSSPTVSFVLPAIEDGSYLVRVRVDGAESRLVYDQAAGVFTGPTYQVAA
jgi:Pvc16 N-terminal domain